MTLTPQARVVGYLSVVQNVVAPTREELTWIVEPRIEPRTSLRRAGTEPVIQMTVSLLEVVGCIVCPLNGTVQLASLFRGAKTLRWCHHLIHLTQQSF